MYRTNKEAIEFFGHFLCVPIYLFILMRFFECTL